MAKPDEGVMGGEMRAPAGRPALSEAELERRRGRPWSLKVVKAFDVAPRMRRVQLAMDGALDEFTPKPGQEIVLQIPQAGGEPARRHYTIRRLDRATKIIDVDFVLHGHRTPGVSWALDARPGDVVDIRGPRGRISLDLAADWHLFLGDETAIPAILNMLEALPKGAPVHAFVEIGSDADKQEPATEANLQLRWLSRNGAAPGPNDLLFQALAGFAFPAGKGRCITIGETGNIRNLRHALIERGVDRAQIFSEGYWRPGRIGGHDHVDQ
jgi:NADPH-dependent ferric siderophore reductase